MIHHGGPGKKVPLLVSTRRGGDTLPFTHCHYFLSQMRPSSWKIYPKLYFRLDIEVLDPGYYFLLKNWLICCVSQNWSARVGRWLSAYALLTARLRIKTASGVRIWDKSPLPRSLKIKTLWEFCIRITFKVANKLHTQYEKDRWCFSNAMRKFMILFFFFFFINSLHLCVLEKNSLCCLLLHCKEKRWQTCFVCWSFVLKVCSSLISDYSLLREQQKNLRRPLKKHMCQAATAPLITALFEQ